jgi:hypothetical protein
LKVVGDAWLTVIVGKVLYIDTEKGPKLRREEMAG